MGKPAKGLYQTGLWSIKQWCVRRTQLGAMITRVESAQNWLESLTYQMDHMSYKEQSDKLAGEIAFLKSYATRNHVQQTATDAVRIFGRKGITRTGLGRTTEYISFLMLLPVFHRADD
jgi:phage protein D